MPIKFACSCGKHLKARYEMAGRRSMCPRCGAPVGIPSLQPTHRGATLGPASLVQGQRPGLGAHSSLATPASQTIVEVSGQGLGSRSSESSRLGPATIPKLHGGWRQRRWVETRWYQSLLLPKGAWPLLFGLAFILTILCIGFALSLPAPVERLPSAAAAAEAARGGKSMFQTIGCADCHTPNVGSVEGIYSDLLLHRMGPDLVGGGSYNEPPPETPSFKPGGAPRADEWRTPPLWGVADSAPYMHDGRAPTLEEAIQLHGGQGAQAAGRYAKLSPAEQAQLIAFLKTLRAPVP